MLSKNQSRRDVLEILEAGLQAIDTKTIIRNTLKIENDFLWVRESAFQLKKFRRIFVVGVGKCALDAAGALEDVLGPRLAGGIVCDVRDGRLQKIQSYCGDHPFPSQKNVDVTEKMIHLLKDLTQNDMVIFVVSGGGSTLLCQPKDLTCLDEKSIVRCLFQSGANIEQINTVRKHLSLARGGYLAKYAYPATGISLLFSDISGDDPQYIASGPTVLDTSHVSDAKKIVKKFDIQARCGLQNLRLNETSKDRRYFRKMHYFLVASNTIALTAMEQEARKKGYATKVCDRYLTGEAREVGAHIARELKIQPPKAVLLYGGETTVTFDHAPRGRGGRNLELSLAALRVIQQNQIIVSLASDGRDNSSYAGGIADFETKKIAQKHGLDIDFYLSRHDAWHFFKSTECFIRTGKTGSNVADLIVAMKT